MRQIKFKGLSVNGEWYNGLLSHSQGTKGHHIPEGWYISNKSGMPWAYQVIPETVGQMSPFADKNETCIYEGDLLAALSEDIGPMWVIFENGSFTLHNRFGRWGLLSRRFDPDFAKWPVEVIGSIHTDHPDFKGLHEARRDATRA